MAPQPLSKLAKLKQTILKGPDKSSSGTADMTPITPDVTRRNFLMTGAAAGGAVVAASVPGVTNAANPENLPPNVPEWSSMLGEAVDTTPYGQPSPFESHVVRRNVEWLTSTTEASINFTPLANLHGIITPNGLAFCRHHAGAAEVDPADHRLIIHGMVEREIILTMEDLLRLPSVSRIHFLECAANGGMEWRGAQMEAVQFTHGMINCCEWTGVKLSTVLEHAGVKSNAKWILAEGADAAGMTRSIPMEKALDDAILVYAQNGEMLRPEQGYPLRLLIPGWEGNMSIKWLRRLEIGDQPWHTREETSKYTDLLESGKARRFTWAQETNSVITSIAPERPLNGKGFYEISGIAWSGSGKIKRVDVSVDGGRNWTTAAIDGPVLDKALVRFRMPWNWNGDERLIQSRAMDETGYVQPTFSQLREARGTWSIYHRHAIHSWLIRSSGEVENVQLS